MSQTDTRYVGLDRIGRIATILFDHPRKHNSLSSALIAQVIQAIDEIEAEGTLDILILRARPGVKVWSAGHDVNELPATHRDPLGYQDPLEQVLRRVQDYQMPVIAMVEGTVWGGACDLVLACDIVVCGEDSTFGMTPAKLGVPYNASGLVRFLHVLGPHKAKEMFFTARPVTAAEAHNMRMVNHVLPRGELEEFTFKLAQGIAGNAPLAVQVLKRQFRLLLKGQLLSTETFERIQGMRREVYDSEDYCEGLRAFREKRKPVFNGV